MIQAAGILFYNPDGMILFLKRSETGDHAGEWCFPGGTLEEGEDALTAARREVVEELGSFPEADEPVLWARQVAVAEGLPAEGETPPEQVDFTTFRSKVDAQFAPTLDGEHTSWMWAPLSQPPEPLHPGCRVALEKFAMNELDIARAIVAGDLSSPQKYMNITLFAVRITGTGAAFRHGLKEVVFRDPSMYLTPEFLARCNGLPVILEHPEGTMVTTEDFNTRTIGTILLPYVKGDEVWGIAKIYDAPAAEMMATKVLSTSPSVVFRGAAGETQQLDNGNTLLIEGDPPLLDHLAICRQGVWDKGGPPTGVDSVTTGDKPMADEKDDKTAAEEVKSDARKDADDNVDKLLSKMDSISARLDAWEAEDKKRADAAAKDADEDEKKDDDEEGEDEPEPVVAKDKARKDATEEKVAEMRADADTLRADLAATKALLAEVQGKLPKPRTDADYAALAEAQGRADAVLSNFGQSASRPMDGESLLAYKRRLVAGLKKYSAPWKDVDLTVINDEAAFTQVEHQIYRDAVAASMSPSSVEGIGLREVRKRDDAGRLYTTFVGDPHAWMDAFGGSRKYLNSINTKGVQ